MGKGETGRKGPERSFCEIRAPKKRGRGENRPHHAPHPKIASPTEAAGSVPVFGERRVGAGRVFLSRMLPSPPPLAPGRKVHGCGVDKRPSGTRVTAQKGRIHSRPPGPCTLPISSCVAETGFNQ